jgi:hypothetical protein
LLLFVIIFVKDLPSVIHTAVFMGGRGCTWIEMSKETCMNSSVSEYIIPSNGRRRKGRGYSDNSEVLFAGLW